MRFAAVLAALVLLAGSPAPALAQPLQQPDAKSVRVVLDRRHRLVVDGVASTPETVVATLDRLTGKDHVRLVILSAPASTRYGEVAAVVSRLEQGGYKELMVVSSNPRRS
jgi:biopolymer transport protein ExbD